VANITLKIDDALLEKARRLAFLKKTSINAVVKQRIEQFVAGDFNREAALKGLDAFVQKTNAKVGKKTWTREEIHER